MMAPWTPALRPANARTAHYKDGQQAGAGMANPAVKMSMDSAVAHKDMANAIRALAMDAVEKAKCGHPGMPMGMADVATVLFTRFLKFDASAPELAGPRPLRAVGRATAPCCSMRCSISPAIPA